MPMTTTPPKVYTIRDIPRPPDMADYLARVRAVSERLAKLPGMPDPPPDMERLNEQEANDIELALLGAELYVGVNGKARKVTAAYIGVNGKARRFL